MPPDTLRDRTAVAVADPVLKSNLRNAVDRFSTARERGLGELVDPDGLRHAARAMRGHIIGDWAPTLERLADKLLANGAHVCWATDADEANAYIRDVARRIGATSVVKSKSMATEEIGLNDVLAADGRKVTETDLGEWIIQLAGEHPSHIIVPAVHRNRHQIADTFQAEAGMVERRTEPEELTAFARTALRERFLEADLGISGANLGVADTGSIVLVTNEGNGRLVTSLPKVHIAVLGAERIVQTWDQADLLLALLARSATGQRLTTYTSVVTGPRRAGEADGPDELHVVILDNGRTGLAGTEFAEMLNCIRCGACLNVCPVYRQAGGHAYGWVYPGPMGAVLTPLLAAKEAEGGGPAELAGASTLCGACMEACPVEIPLQDLLLALRRKKATEGGARGEHAIWRAWSEAWSRPALYRAGNKAAVRMRRLAPVAAKLGLAKRWTAGRELPALGERTFTERWASGER